MTEMQKTGPVAPEGFQLSGSANAVGWWDMATAGNVLTGKLLGVFERKDVLRQQQGGTSKFFQVEVTAPCQVRAGRGDDADMVEAKVGDVVNVNYGPKTKPWENFMADIKQGAEYAVWAYPTGEKQKISGGRSMHVIDARHRMVRPPTDVPELADDEGDEGEGDEAAAS